MRAECQGVRASAALGCWAVVCVRALRVLRYVRRLSTISYSAGQGGCSPLPCGGECDGPRSRAAHSPIWTCCSGRPMPVAQFWSCRLILAGAVSKSGKRPRI